MESHIDIRRLLTVIERLRGGGTVNAIVDAYMHTYPPTQDESRRKVRAWRARKIKEKLQIFYEGGLIGTARAYDKKTDSLKDHFEITAVGRHFLHIE